MSSVAHCFGQAASDYDQHAALQRLAGQRLLAQARPADTWLDLGTGTGQVARQLPGRRVLALDLAPAMLRQAAQQGTAHLICGDITRLPLQASSVDGIAANLSLQWCDPLADTLTGLANALRPGGQLLATVPLAHTFPELRPLCNQGLLACNRFATTQALAATLADGPWAQTRLTPFTEVVHFDSPRALLGHFKATGAHHSPERHPGLRGRQWWQRLNAELARHRDAQGYRLTWHLAILEATR
ncbi:methyltransferase domain-containing protein [Ferrimonas balearica]|uniref:methyltransferase domain-containing protein n=1 Tax=Ferrimonas balearica TaxID=44012 RepID=UPI001C990650|nr:methyltransferase domain-containing protein [Ferrimonas balearica]MBY5991055.1 methyltransferase domain-containing protein [Ferrimonas balearica]